MQQKDHLKKSLLYIPFAIFLFYTVILFLTATEFFLGMSLSLGNTLFSLAVAVIYLFLCRNKYSHYMFTIFILALFFFGMCSYFLWDLSWDGRWYHTDFTLGFVKEKWSPVRKRFPEWLFIDVNIYMFPKSYEILAAHLYLLFQDLELAKIVNILPVLAMFFIILEYLKNKLQHRYAVIFSLALAFSPTVLSQMFTLYLDGFLYSIVGSYIFLALLNHEQKQQMFSYDFIIMKSMLMIISFGVKMTSIPFMIILVGADMLVFATKRKKFIKESCLLLGVSLFALLYIDFHPYMTNFIETGNPFFPVMDKATNALIMVKNTPVDFRSVPPLKSFFLSYFSQPSNSTQAESLNFHFKILPVALEGSTYDIRINGFGFYTPVLLIISLISYGLLFFNKKMDKQILFYMGAVWLSVFLMPYSWWARYVPQMWIALLLPIIFLISFQTKKILYYNIFIMILSINNIIFFTDIYKIFNASAYARIFFGNFSGKSVLINGPNDFGGNNTYYSFIEKAEKNNISYQISNEKFFGRFWSWEVIEFNTNNLKKRG